jgi:inorganic triphosphatase YgiF
LNNVLAEFEGAFTGELHALLEAYGNASHRKLSLPSLQLSRAKIDQQAFKKRLSKAAGKNRKLAKIFKRLIKDRKQAVRAHTMVYEAEAAAEMNFVHSLAFNERAAMSKDYVKRNIDSACRLPIAKGSFFRGRANYDPYDRTGGAKNRYGAVRFKLRNTYRNWASFPQFKNRGHISATVQRDALINKEEYYKYKSRAECSIALTNYIDTALSVAMFYQTEIRFDVRGTSDALKKQPDAARKPSKKYKFKLPKFASSERKENRKLAKFFRN